MLHHMHERKLVFETHAVDIITVELMYNGECVGELIFIPVHKRVCL